MHLQSLEVQGFKSFADRTRLRFEPGIAAIVGPNGCGKSNISDAIRWVLGEQRPTALRSGKMQDVIFDGSESRKPLGVAEVSISFAECETTLETEYNELTVTRRVHRSGESQYFINRTACRLRDIHRLFMGTGIGTSSYSVMAQGQIDAILSSRPEDRRVIFEEASGITKFKSDRTEALRKLEQTDANLLRLGDVIREVKRQIGSLQRQAGKARRYREMQTELRRLDLFSTRRQLATLDAAILKLESGGQALQQEESEARAGLSEAEAEATRLREKALEMERDLGLAGETIAHAQARLSRARETLRLNAHRITEHEEFAARDHREIEEIQRDIHEREIALAAARERLAAAREAQEKAGKTLAARQESHRGLRAALDAAQITLHRLRENLMDRERAIARTQNALADLDARHRHAAVQRERLRGEQEQLQQTAETVQQRREALSDSLAESDARVRESGERLKARETRLETLETEIRAAREGSAALQAEQAAHQAQLALYQRQESAQEGFPEGNRRLMESCDTSAREILGPVAAKLDCDAEFRPALQSAVYAWIDAILVRDRAAAHALLSALAQATPPAAVRLLCAALAPEISDVAPLPKAPKAPDGTSLPRFLDIIRITEDFSDVAQRMLENVFLAETIDTVPASLPVGTVVVTRDGTLIRADGLVEQSPEATHNTNPLARQLAIRDLESTCKTYIQRIETRDKEIQARVTRFEQARAAVQETRTELSAAQQRKSQQEGECRSLDHDAERIRRRIETVATEIKDCERASLTEEQQKTEMSQRSAQLLSERESLLERIDEQSRQNQTAESRVTQSQQELAEARVEQAAAVQQTAQIGREVREGEQRIEDLKRQAERRRENRETSHERMRTLQTESSAIEAGLGELEVEAETAQHKADALRNQRARHTIEREQSESRLAQARKRLDSALTHKSARDLELAETRMHRENRFERIRNEYGLTPDQLVREPDPDWSGNPPESPELDTRILELREAMQSMGPVNLVAIDTYQELEERHAFLTAQESDLIKARDQILDLVRRINKKSAELFRETFEHANTNFQRMFQELFHGGNARLVLMEEDVLESGIDIVAQPPGKKLQNISLLSGGERTLTAVSLLFAIYLVKPSPFCLLDEIDAALDDSNIGRFVAMLKNFLTQSQFVIITHNPHTIASADVVYGVTMPETGVSRVVSMRLPQETQPELPLEDVAAPPPPDTTETP